MSTYRVSPPVKQPEWHQLLGWVCDYVSTVCGCCGEQHGVGRAGGPGETMLTRVSVHLHVSVDMGRDLLRFGCRKVARNLLVLTKILMQSSAVVCPLYC